MPIWNIINATWITDLCLNRSLLFGHCYVEIKIQQASCQFLWRLQNVIAMHTGKVLYTSCAGKYDARYKTNFISLKTVLTFQTLMLATLGKWAKTHGRVFSLGKNCSWTLLPGSTWLQTPITRLYQSSIQSYRTHFASLKCIWSEK